MVKTAETKYYYAIREMGEDDAYQGYSVPRDPMSYPVAYISWSHHAYASSWIHRRINRMSRHIAFIEKWEYDMLDAVDVPKMTMKEAIKWGNP